MAILLGGQSKGSVALAKRLKDGPAPMRDDDPRVLAAKGPVAEPGSHLEGMGSVVEAKAVDDMTVKELRSFLAASGVEFASKLRKAGLLKLAKKV